MTPYLLPIRLSQDLTLTDYYDPDTERESRDKAFLVFKEQMELLVTEVEATSSARPGCHHIWAAKDALDFREQRGTQGGFTSYRAYREAQKSLRATQELSGRACTLLAWRGGEPAGGIALYISKLVGRREGTGVVECVSHIGPFIDSREDSAAFMGYALENELDAVSSLNVRERLQLIRWEFPTEVDQNRWYVDTPVADVWNLSLEGYTSEYAVNAIGARYRVSVTL